MDAKIVYCTVLSLLEQIDRLISSVREVDFNLESWREFTRIEMELNKIKDHDFGKIIHLFQLDKLDIDSIVSVSEKILQSYKNNEAILEEKAVDLYSLVNNEIYKTFKFELDDISKRINKLRELCDLVHNAVRFKNSLDVRGSNEENDIILCDYLNSINHKTDKILVAEDLDREYDRIQMELKEANEELNQVNEKQTSEANKLIKEIDVCALNKIEKHISEILSLCPKTCTGHKWDDLTFKELFESDNDYRIVAELIASYINKITREEAAKIYNVLKPKLKPGVPATVFLQKFHDAFPKQYPSKSNNSINYKNPEHVPRIVIELDEKLSQKN